MKMLKLEDILLDNANPRFGDRKNTMDEQNKILDHIVDNFDVDDVLSSIAVNGYFTSEPLVCQWDQKNKKYIVKEGNRRLTACLILDGDPRASSHKTRTSKYKKLWEENGKIQINPVPAIIFDTEDRNSILSYLGVRHIAATQPWDSYAKASWVAEVVKENDLSIEKIAEMIGVNVNTITRQLEGYYLVNQMMREKVFQPEDSIRKGRGSQSEFPFSWVYTILGYKSVRKFLLLEDNAELPKEEILEKQNFDRGALVLNSMFGDSNAGRNASIKESRELKGLAGVFDSEEKISLLNQGKSVEEIEKTTRSIDRQISEDISQTREIMRNLIGQLAEHGIISKDISEEDVERLIDSAEKNETLAKELNQKVIEFCKGSDINDD